MNPLLKHVDQKAVTVEKIQRAIIEMITEVYSVHVEPVPYHEKTMTRLGDEWGLNGRLYNSILLKKEKDKVVVGFSGSDSDGLNRDITSLPITEEDADWIGWMAGVLRWQPKV